MADLECLTIVWVLKIIFIKDLKKKTDSHMLPQFKIARSGLPQSNSLTLLSE